MNKPETLSAERGADSGAESSSAATCDKCDYWSLRGAETPPLRLLGYCDMFDKITDAKHGTKCTGWTPQESV